MSDDKGFVAPVNVVKPTSNQPSDIQDLQDANPLMPTNSICLPPDAPPVLIAALCKEIEPFDLFTEPFGTVNKYGETVLFEHPVDVCFLGSYNNAINNIICSSIHGKVAIIFHPDKRKVFIIVHRSDSFWPCATKELLKNTAFGIDGCAVEWSQSYYYLRPGKIIHNAQYLFEVQSSVFIKFSNENKLIQFKNVIRNVQSRISMNRIPTTDLKKGSAHVISEFWLQSAIRPCSVKLLCLHEALIWTKIEGSKPATSEHGIVAFAQSKIDTTLQLITISKNGKTNVQVSENFTLIPSDISPTAKNVWEWFNDYQNRHACGFETVKEAYDFKVVIDYYMDALKKKSLSWDW